MSKYIFITRADILILDDIFPHKLSVFRIVEFTAYLKKYKTVVMSTATAFSAVGETESFGKIKEEYLSNNGLEALGDSIKQFVPNQYIKSKLCYFVFQNNGTTFLSYIEKLKTPFVFTLYPGGGLNIKNEQSKIQLKKIFSSAYFREVIVTQNVTKNYLLENGLCSADKINFIFGAPIEFEITDNCTRINFEDKLSIVFSAHKYMANGEDKGFDLFIETLRILKSKNIVFDANVIGGFSPEDYNIDNLDITFHGKLNIINLRELYKQSDIILSPNRAYKLSEGAFDGFPTASVIEAGLQYVAMFVTDELGQNNCLLSPEEIVLIDHDVNSIANKIMHYNSHRNELNELKQKGREKLTKLYSYENQIGKRVEIINKYV